MADVNYWRDRIFILCSAALFMLFNAAFLPSGTEGVLRLICLDMGLIEDCTDNEATLELASYNLKTVLVNSFSMILSVGIAGVLTDKWGRKPILAISFFTLAIPSFTLLVIFHEETGFFRTNWRIIYLLANLIGHLNGGVFMIMSIWFTFMSDITRENPSTRAAIFTLLEGIIGVGGILGSFLGGPIMDKSSRSLFLFTSILISICFFVTIIFMRETVTPESKARVIEWKYATAFGALLILCPTQRSKRLLEEDAIDTFEKINQQNLALLKATKSASDLESGEIYQAKNLSITRRTSSVLASNSDMQGFGGEVGAISSMHDAAKSADVFFSHDDDGDRDDSGNVANKEYGIFNAISQEEIDADALYENYRDSIGDYPESYGTSIVASSHSINQSENSSNALQVNFHPGTNIPILVHPPRGNALYILSTCLASYAIIIVAFYAVVIIFLKNKFEFTNTLVSLVITIGSLSRTLITFIALPFVAPFLTTRLSELRALQVLFIFSSISLLTFALSSYLDISSLIFVASGLFFTSAALVAAFVRGLLSTEVGPSMQGRVFAAVASIEVFASAIAGTGSLKLYSFLHDSPHFLFLILAILMLLAALLPFLINDSVQDFNMRTGGLGGHGKKSKSKLAALFTCCKKKSEEPDVKARLLAKQSSSD